VPPLSHTVLPGGVALVRMASFPRRVASDLDSLLQALHPKGLILDLRNNPGGLFDEAVEVCDVFLQGGPIVSATGKRGRAVEQRVARDRASQVGYPVAILIDGGSASAAEVVAGALQDRGRARLFGQRSYGKGSVQSILDLSDGSGLKLTIARYVTPSGRQIDGQGIGPDELCEPAGEGHDEALDRATAWVRSQM
jgi:carboxyl-terminal processing protease